MSVFDRNRVGRLVGLIVGCYNRGEFKYLFYLKNYEKIHY